MCVGIEEARKQEAIWIKCVLCF